MPGLDAYAREIRPTLALAMPIVVGQVSQMLMGVLDSVMIGHVGKVPLAAAAFGVGVFNIFYIAGVGIMVPVSIFVARARGAQRPEEAGEYLRHGVLFALVVGAVETLAMAAVSTQFAHFKQPPEVVAIVRPFFLLFAFSLTPVLLYLALRQFAEAMGHPWAPMCIVLASVGLNAGLNWVLIYGHLGVPALGLTGAGIATFTSRLAGLLVIFLWLRRDPKVRAAWPAKWFGHYSRARLEEMLRIGLPAAGMLVFESSAFTFSAFMMGRLGTTPLAAHMIAITCATLTFMFPLGLSMAAGMRVSHALGAGERARLRPIGFGAVALGVAAMIVFALTFGFGGRRIATWFVGDPAVIALATQLFVVAGLFQLVDGMQVIGASVLRAVRDVKVPTAITFVAYWVIALPLSYAVGVRGPLGAVGVWVGLACGLAFAAVFLNVRFARLTRSC